MKLFSFGTFGLWFLIGVLVVAVGLALLFGPTNPVAWLLVGVLVLIPVIHNRLMARRFLTWQDDYAIGIEAIDNDHRKLLRLINQLQTASQYFTEEAYERQALDELVDYTKTHFGREEDLMREHAFPGFDEHKREHELMVEKVKELMDRYRADSHAGIEETLQFLKKWLVEHIAGTDKQYGPFLRERGVR